MLHAILSVVLLLRHEFVLCSVSVSRNVMLVSCKHTVVVFSLQLMFQQQSACSSGGLWWHVSWVS